jgi:hypothetical protein
MRALSLKGEGRAGYVVESQAENNDKYDSRYQPFERESFALSIDYHFNHLLFQYFQFLFEQLLCRGLKFLALL